MPAVSWRPRNAARTSLAWFLSSRRRCSPPSSRFSQPVSLVNPPNLLSKIAKPAGVPEASLRCAMRDETRRPHVRLSTGRPVSQYAGSEGCTGSPPTQIARCSPSTTRRTAWRSTPRSAATVNRSSSSPTRRPTSECRTSSPARRPRPVLARAVRDGLPGCRISQGEQLPRKSMVYSPRLRRLLALRSAEADSGLPG